MHPTLLVFIIFNVIFAVATFLTSLLALGCIVYATQESLPEDEMMVTLVLYGVLTVILLLMALAYSMAAIGLLLRKPWGFYTHLVAAGLTALNPACCCLGIIYTLPAFMVTLSPNGREALGMPAPPVTPTPSPENP